MKLHIIGAGGHAKTVLDSLNEKKYSKIIFYDDRYPKINKIINHNIEGKTDELICNKTDMYFVAIGDNQIRKNYIKQILSKNLNLETVVNSSSLVSQYSKIEPGTLIGPRAIVNADAYIGIGSIINTSAIIEHDCIVRDFSHIAPNSVLGGGVIINEMSLIGIGAIILPNVKIQSNSLIKAGSIIKK